MASIFDLRDLLHRKSLDRYARLLGPEDPLHQDYEIATEEGSVRMAVESVVGPRLPAFMTREIQVRVHNPYYLDQPDGSDERTHHSEASVSWSGRVGVDYNLSTGSHQGSCGR